MPDKDKKSLKDKRQDRQKGRVEKFTEKRKAEAKSVGVDLDKPIDLGPSGSERKARVDKILTKDAEDNVKAGLQKFQDLRTPPKPDVTDAPKADYTIKDVRKQRRLKTADILNSAASGWLGQEINPTMFRDKAKENRLGQYEQYRDSSKAAKKTLRDWESGYVDDQLDFLQELSKEPSLSPLKKQQLEKQIEKIQADIDWKKAQTANIGKNKKKDPAEDKGVKIVSKVGGDQTITEYKPQDEADQLKLEGRIKEETKVVNQDIKDKKSEIAELEDTWHVRDDGPKLEAARAELIALEEERQRVIDKVTGAPSDRPEAVQLTKKQINTVGGSDNPFLNTINKNK